MGRMRDDLDPAEGDPLVDRLVLEQEPLGRVVLHHDVGDVGGPSYGWSRPIR